MYFVITVYSNTPCTSRLGQFPWVCWDQSCYLLLADQYSYTDANEACASQCNSSHLLVLNSQEEDDFIRSTLHQHESIWIGCSDEEDEGHWHCVDHMGMHYDETTGEIEGYWRK